MTQKQTLHPHLTFAQRHSQAILSTLNASAALSRVQSLLGDLDELQAAIKAHKQAGSSKGRRLYWFEITSYYPAGFVTCLEWHARSRLVDLLTYRPSAVRADDLKGHVNEKLLVQSIAAGVSVPQLMGAITTVGSSERYIGIFDRILSDLSVDCSAREILSPIILKMGNEGKSFDALQQVFDYRNTIVHEISYSTVGPWLVRDAIDVDEAREMGLIARETIEAIEAKLSQSAQKTFQINWIRLWRPKMNLSI